MDFLLKVFEENAERDAIAWKGRLFSHRWLADRVRYWEAELSRTTAAGSVVSVSTDFSPNAVALFLALVRRRCVLVPLSASEVGAEQELLDIAEVEFAFVIDSDDTVTWKKIGRTTSNELLARLRESGHPGLVLFSSGSTGVRKGAVHDLDRILEKFKVPRKRMRAVAFLLYDHIGGVNTMLHVLANGGCLVTVQARDADSVLSAIERHRVELLPTSPSFLNLMLLGESHRRYDLSSLRVISYGTEPMPETTLARIHKLLPNVKLLQTYGLSELGILRSKSRSSDSLWVKVGGEGFQTRVVDGILQVRADSAMLGYLNAPSPFTADGWFDTGDMIETEGEYIRIVGRRSEVINVGGQKVHPVEVENVILEVEGVADVTVYPEKNSILGEIVCATVQVRSPQDRDRMTSEVKSHCRRRLEPFMVPMKVKVDSAPKHGWRLKKLRRLAADGE